MALTREGFTQAVTEHSRAMFRAARAILDCDADAEDAVGQAVLLAWQSRGKLREEGAARAWLVKIAVNCARRLRQKNGRMLYFDDLEQIAGSGTDRQYHELWEAVLALPPESRAVVVLFYYEDLTVEQIAKTLKIPQGTVKSRLSRAREKLRTMLCEEAEQA